MIEITKDNVQRLWEMYEEYKKDHNENFRCEPLPFEYIVKERIVYCESDMDYHWKTDVFKCENCGEYRLEDEMSKSELALQDCICEYCMQDGYGK